MRDLSLPTIVASSVIRSTHQGESHGGVYLVDLNTESYKQVIDWDDPTISWEGRGADRGLRGIAIWNDRLYLAASNEVFIFDKKFSLIGSLKNEYLNHCHEIDVWDDRLYLTSTGFDAVLEVDLTTHQFTRGFGFRMPSLQYMANWIPRRLAIPKWRVCPQISVFDPSKSDGPEAGDQLHINSVIANNRGLFVSGRLLGCLLHVQVDSKGTERVVGHIPTPFGTHNVIPLNSELGEIRVLMNDTNSDAVTLINKEGEKINQWPIVRYNEKDLLRNDIPEDHARQAFGRGLCTWNNRSVIVGSSPATITAYSLQSSERLASVALTMDVRNAIHGLEVWPFDR